MAEESAFKFAESLFSEFREDNFFTPAFKTLAYTVITPYGNMFEVAIRKSFSSTTIFWSADSTYFSEGETEAIDNYTATCQEIGGSAKQRAVAMIDNIQATDIMIKGLVSEIEPPENGKPFTFDGVELIAVNQMRDPTGATFTLFGRGT